MNVRKLLRNRVLYQLKGRERDEIAALIRQIAAAQGALQTLARHVVTREGLDPQTVVFDVQKMAFVRAPSGPQS